MKTLISVLFLLFFLVVNSLHAQTDSAATRVEFMYVAVGFNISAAGFTNADNMRKLAKDHSAALLNENLAPYYKGISSYASDVYPELAAGVGFRLWDKKKGIFRKSTLRLSLRYSEFSPLNVYYSVDSLAYAGTYYNTNSNFQPIVINEVKHSHYSMNYHVDVLQLEAAQYFHTKEVRRVSVYGGYALSLGASVFSRIEVSKGYYTEYSEQKNTQQSSGLFFHKFIDSDYEYDRYKANAAFTAGAGLVTGIQLRLSKKNNAFGRLIYAIEMQPKINAFVIKNSNAPLIPGFSCTSIIKYRF